MIYLFIIIILITILLYLVINDNHKFLFILSIVLITTSILTFLTKNIVINIIKVKFNVINLSKIIPIISDKFSTYALVPLFTGLILLITYLAVKITEKFAKMWYYMV